MLTNRRVRMVILVLFGPALLTAGNMLAVFGFLYLVELRYSREQIEFACLIAFVWWQTIAIWWLWRNWNG